MRRRQPVEPVDEMDGGMPLRLRRFRLEDWWDPGEQPPADWELGRLATAGFYRYCRARERWHAASRRWCAERGYSYARTVLGWRKPSPSEQAAGCLTVPGESR